MRFTLALLIIITFLGFFFRKEAYSLKTPQENLKHAQVDSKVFPGDDGSEIINLLKKDTSCNCSDHYTTQRMISYGDRFLQFCSLDFIPSDSSTREFQLLDDRDEILLYGDYTYEFKIRSFKRPFRLVQKYEIPNSLNDDTMVPIFEYRIMLKDSDFIVRKKYIYHPPEVARSRVDSALSVYHNRVKVEKNTNSKDAPLLGEEVLMALFLGAVNGDMDGLHAFEDLSSRYMIFGHVAEVYGQLKTILEGYKKEHQIQ